MLPRPGSEYIPYPKGARVTPKAPHLSWGQPPAAWKSPSEGLILKSCIVSTCLGNLFSRITAATAFLLLWYRWGRAKETRGHSSFLIASPLLLPWMQASAKPLPSPASLFIFQLWFLEEACCTAAPGPSSAGSPAAGLAVHEQRVSARSRGHWSSVLLLPGTVGLDKAVCTRMASRVLALSNLKVSF